MKCPHLVYFELPADTLDKAFPDVAFGPKFTDGYWGLEATLYDMFMMAPENQKRDPIPFGTILEASVYHRPGGKVVGVGAEYFAFSAFDIPNEIKPLMCLIPNPQAMVSLYGDGKPGVAASVFFMMLAIPYVEYDFKLRKVAAGAMLKFPILASGQ